MPLAVGGGVLLLLLVGGVVGCLLKSRQERHDYQSIEVETDDQMHLGHRS